jgi:replication-associated recombination protein RarA
MRIKPLFSEILRPRELADLALPPKDIEHLKQMIASGAIMNLLFSGDTGTGKTSVARVILSIVSPDNSIEIDGSLLTEVDCVREQIEGYSSSMSLMRGPKICFVDQADLAAKSAQNSLLKVIENSSRSVRYIFTITDRAKIISGLRSRFTIICCDVPEPNQADVQMRLMDRYRRTFTEMEIPYAEDRVREIVHSYYPDLRCIANYLDLEFATPAYAQQRQPLGRDADAPRLSS